MQLHAAVAEQLLDVASLEEAAHRTVELVVRHRAADVAGLSRHSRRGTPRRLGASDAVLVELDRLRPASTPTPRGLPLAPGDLVVVDDTSRDARWPAWGAAAAALGLRSAVLLGTPPVPSAPCMLELYSRRPRAFRGAAATTAAQLAQQTGLLLRHVDRASNLTVALQSRGVVGQAQGILMERYGLTGEQAMAYLRRHSQESHLKLHDIAGQLVAGREVESRGEHDIPGS